MINSMSYSFRLREVPSDRFCLPVDTIYYIESATDSELNELVRKYLKEIGDFLKEVKQSDNGLLRYKLQYVSRDSRSDLREVLDLHPELDRTSKMVGLAGGNRFTEKGQEQHPEAPSDSLLAHNFVCRLMPRALGEDLTTLYALDMKPGSAAELLNALEAYVYELNAFNREILLQGDRFCFAEVREKIPMLIAERVTLGELEAYAEKRRKKAAKRMEQSQMDMIDHIPFCIEPDNSSDAPNEEMHQSVSSSCRFSFGSDDDWPKEDMIESDSMMSRWKRRLRKEVEPPQANPTGNCFSRPRKEPSVDEMLRQRAMDIKKEIEELQRKNGINIWSELMYAQIIDQLRGDRPAAVSPILVNHQYRVLLPDYDIEIPLSTLPKALYILFLRHPEGIDKNDMENYRTELRTIYLTISGRDDVAAMNRSIDDLVAPCSESFNQKVSRINAAFRQRLASDVAAPYLIQGPRGEKKQVAVANTAELPEELRFS